MDQERLSRQIPVHRQDRDKAVAAHRLGLQRAELLVHMRHARVSEVSGWGATADVEGGVVPNGLGQGLEPPSKPIGCIPNIAAGILGLLCGETCVSSRVGRVRSVQSV